MLIFFFSEPNNCNDDFVNSVGWTKFKVGEENYLNIGRYLVMDNNLLSDRYKVWNRLFPI